MVVCMGRSYKTRVTDWGIETSVLSVGVGVSLMFHPHHSREGSSYSGGTCCKHSCRLTPVGCGETIRTTRITAAGKAKTVLVLASKSPARHSVIPTLSRRISIAIEKKNRTRQENSKIKGKIRMYVTILLYRFIIYQLSRSTCHLSYILNQYFM